MDDRADLDDLIAGAEACHEAVERLLEISLPTLVMGDLGNDLSKVVAVAIARRQSAALGAAASLARQGNGHLALPLVRPACEERIWLEYLFTLDVELRQRLLSLMGLLESAKTINAQQQYLGSAEMKRLGFPKAFVNAKARSRPSIEADLAELGRVLGWPPDAGLPPSTGWVATASGLSQLYDFLYSASSKGVHFSPTEYLRGGWSDALHAEAVVELPAKQYIQYRSAFTLHWLSDLLLRTAATVVGELEASAELDEDDDIVQSLFAASQKIGAYGRLPIVLASEFNLR